MEDTFLSTLLKHHFSQGKTQQFCFNLLLGNFRNSERTCRSSGVIPSAIQEKIYNTRLGYTSCVLHGLKEDQKRKPDQQTRMKSILETLGEADFICWLDGRGDSHEARRIWNIHQNNINYLIIGEGLGVDSFISFNASYVTHGMPGISTLNGIFNTFELDQETVTLLFGIIITLLNWC